MEPIIVKEKGAKVITPRELEIIRMMADGKHSKHIADDLTISIKTVETHRRNILKKTGCGNMVHLIAVLFRQKLIS